MADTESHIKLLPDIQKHIDAELHWSVFVIPLKNGKAFVNLYDVWRIEPDPKAPKSRSFVYLYSDCDNGE